MAEQYSRVLDHDPLTGTTEYYHFDPVDGSITLETRQDVTDIIEGNTRIRNDNTGRYRDLNLVARMPLSVVMQLVKDGYLDTGFRVIDENRYRRWLNSNENMAWRTRDGRI